jgi:hypothetical protein
MHILVYPQIFLESEERVKQFGDGTSRDKENCIRILKRGRSEAQHEMDFFFEFLRNQE